MKKMIFALALIVAGPAFAADPNINIVKKLTATYIGGKDVKVSVTKIDEDLCGAEGPTYVAVASVRKFERFLNDSGNVALKSVWVKTRTYGITKSDLKAGNKAMIASEQCLE